MTTPTNPAVQTRANLLLVLTSAIWGLGFVAQRLGADLMQPFSFNALRFTLGALSLIPLIMFMTRRSRRREAAALAAGSPAAAAVAVREERIEAYPEPPATTHPHLAPLPPLSERLVSLVVPGIVAGGALFTAAGLQQAALATTPTGTTAFITGLCIVLVPLLGMLVGNPVSSRTWFGLMLAVPGLFLLSISDQLTVTRGEVLVFIGAFFWAGHMLVIDHFLDRFDALRLACAQFFFCALLNAGAALVLEEQPFAGAGPALGAVIYGGIMSVGVAYTLQVVAQQYARPNHTALILSLESVFGALAAFLLLRETMTVRMLIGAGFMLAGVVASLPRGDEVEPAPERSRSEASTAPEA